MSTSVLPSHCCLNNRFHRDSFGSRPPPLRSPPRQKPKSKPSSPKKPPPANGQVLTVLKQQQHEQLKPSPAVDLRSYGEDASDMSFMLYAGPAYSVSPEPSSLPFPVLFVKSTEMATRGLRYLLRLDEFVVWSWKFVLYCRFLGFMIVRVVN